MKRLFVFIALLSLLATSGYGQENSKKGHFSIQTKLTNQLLWRSRPTTNAPTVVPSIDYVTHGLTVGVWGAYAIDNSYQEIDFYVGYQWKRLELWVYDYYSPTTDLSILRAFSEFEKGKTGHTFEANLIAQPFASLPFKIRGAVMFAGNDLDAKVDAQGGVSYEQRYSSYFGFTYDFKIGSVGITPEIGLTPAKGCFADEFSVFNYSVNVTKDIKITEHFTIPTLYTVAYNATLDQMFFSASIIIK